MVAKPFSDLNKNPWMKNKIILKWTLFDAQFMIMSITFGLIAKVTETICDRLLRDKDSKIIQSSEKKVCEHNYPPMPAVCACREVESSVHINKKQQRFSHNITCLSSVGIRWNVCCEETNRCIRIASVGSILCCPLACNWQWMTKWITWLHLKHVSSLFALQN